MFDISFIIPVAPKGKSRHRTANGRAYTPADQVRWEQQFALFAAQHRPEQTLTGALGLYVTAVFSRPKRLRRKKDSENFIYHTSKPDADNVCKSICDALNDTGWWRDDSQVAFMSCTKYYEEKDGPGPRLISALMRIAPGNKKAPPRKNEREVKKCLK